MKLCIILPLYIYIDFVRLEQQAKSKEEKSKKGEGNNKKLRCESLHEMNRSNGWKNILRKTRDIFLHFIRREFHSNISLFTIV